MTSGPGGGIDPVLVCSTPVWSDLWSRFRSGFIGGAVMREPAVHAALDRRQDAIEQISTDRNFSKLEGNGTGMSNDPCTYLDRPGL